MLITTEAAIPSALHFADFVDRSSSPYHAVESCKKIFQGYGYRELKEHDSKWEINPGDKFFVTKNLTTIVACAVGGKWRPGNGFAMVGAHTDSPCLRVKVASKRQQQGYAQVAVECYGEGNWVSWFDRDLKVAGCLMLREPNGRVVPKLIDIRAPVLRIPHVAKHLQPGMNDRFSVDLENDMVPIIATADGRESCASEASRKHHPVLINLIAEKVGIEVHTIVDFDLYLSDFQSPLLGGAKSEFIFAPRIDNLLNVYAGANALASSLGDGSLAEEVNVRMFMGYDNEEVGSVSAQGAGSLFTELVMRRVCSTPHNPTAFEESLGKSMLVSADNWHAVHPNHPHLHELNMRPTLHGGLVIVTSGAQDVATTLFTANILREIARTSGIEIQECMARNGRSHGCSNGPQLSAKLGVKTVDVGAAQLSMHSCREMCGMMAPMQCLYLYYTFFKEYRRAHELVQSDLQG